MTNPSYVSNELTHFLGRSLPDDQRRYALLREIVRTGWLKASPSRPTRARIYGTERRGEGTLRQ